MGLRRLRHRWQSRKEKDECKERPMGDHGWAHRNKRIAIFKLSQYRSKRVSADRICGGERRRLDGGLTAKGSGVVGGRLGCEYGAPKRVNR